MVGTGAEVAVLFSVLSVWFSVSQNKIVIVKSLHARQAQKLGNSGWLQGPDAGRGPGRQPGPRRTPGGDVGLRDAGLGVLLRVILLDEHGAVVTVPSVDPAFPHVCLSPSLEPKWR